jgi:hypothetical protein
VRSSITSVRRALQNLCHLVDQLRAAATGPPAPPPPMRSETARLMVPAASGREQLVDLEGARDASFDAPVEAYAVISRPSSRMCRRWAAARRSEIDQGGLAGTWPDQRVARALRPSARRCWSRSARRTSFRIPILEHRRCHGRSPGSSAGVRGVRQSKRAARPDRRRREMRSRPISDDYQQQADPERLCIAA